jgi:multiple sugar transport system substrate-binding protein
MQVTRRLVTGLLSAGWLFVLTRIAFASGSQEIAAARPAANAPVTLSVWVQADAVRYPGFGAVTKAFEQSHPNVKVQLTNVPGSWADEYEKLLTGYVGGVWPDIVYAKAYALPTFASKGMLLDLTKYWDKAKTGDLNAGPKLQEIVSALSSYDGRVYGLPRGQYWFALGYNTDLFRQAGISGPPRTWAELQQDGIKLTNATKGTWGFDPYTYYRTDSTFVQTRLDMWTAQLAGSIMSYSGETPVYHLAGNEQAKEALQYQLDNIYKYRDWLDPTLDNASDSAALNLIFNNKIAMWWMHGGTISRFEKAAPDLHYLTAPLPAKVNSASYIDSQQWMVNRKTKSPDQAWAYIEYFTSKPAEAMFAPYEGHLSVWPSNWSLPVYAGQPAYQGLIEQYKLAATVPYHYHNGWVPVRAAIAREIQKPLFEKESIEQGLANAQKAADDELKQAGY